MGKVRELHPANQKSVFRNQLVTISDLEDFKTELLLSIKNLLSDKKKKSGKKWLKSYEVMETLNVSRGTLQSLRDSGTLPHTKIGNIIYYNSEDIDNMLLTMKKQLQPIRMRHR